MIQFVVHEVLLQCVLFCRHQEQLVLLTKAAHILKTCLRAVKLEDASLPEGATLSPEVKAGIRTYNLGSLHEIYSLDCHDGVYSLDYHHGVYSLDYHHGVYSLDYHHGVYSLDCHHGVYSLDCHHGVVMFCVVCFR